MYSCIRTAGVASTVATHDLQSEWNITHALAPDNSTTFVPNMYYSITTGTSTCVHVIEHYKALALVPVTWTKFFELSNYLVIVHVYLLEYMYMYNVHVHVPR